MNLFLECKIQIVPDSINNRYEFEKNFFPVIKKKFYRSISFDFYGVKLKFL